MQIERLLRQTLPRCARLRGAATRRWFPASLNAVDREEIRPIHAKSLQRLTTSGRTVVEIAALHW